MRSLVAAWIGLLVVGASAHADPLDRPFGATPAELLAAARGATGEDSVALRHDVTYRYDDQGRLWHDVRFVGVVTAQPGIDTWGNEDVSWWASYEGRPAFHARVVAPDGSVVEIDPSQVSDSVPSGPGADRHVLHISLPHVVVGSVVEEEYTVADLAPIVDAGSLVRIDVPQGIPVRHTVVTLDAPAAHPLHVSVRGFAKPPTARTRTAGGRTTWTYDVGPIEPRRTVDASLPSDAAPWATIVASSATDWAAVAASYRRVVDARAKDIALPDGVRGATARETMDRALAWLQSHVRSTKLDFREAAITPVAPADVIASETGDELSRAVLLAAVLRAAGVHADLALIWSDYDGGPDVDRNEPGLEWFDGAIVRARIDGADVWIDPAEADTPAGDLPAGDQGRLALVIADDTHDLVALPVAPATDNLVHEERIYHLAELDNARVTEREEWHGVFGGLLRVWARGDGETRKTLEDDVDRDFGGHIEGVSGTHATDVVQPAVLTVEIADASYASTSRDEISVWLRAADVLANLPAPVGDGDDELEDAVRSRTADYVWPWPHVHEIVQRLEVPPGFTPPALVAHEERALGTMTLTTTRAMDGDTIVITYRLDTGPRRITAAQLAATRAAVHAFRDEPSEHVAIPLVSMQLLQQNKLKEGIAECQRLIALHPKEAVHWDQLANAYRYAGMGQAARRAAREGTRLEPKRADAWVMLASELALDSTGRAHGWDSDRAGAIATYRKALAIWPTHLGGLEGLAELLATDEEGGLTTNLADRREALELRRRAAAIAPDDADDRRALVDALLDTGAYAEADDAAQKLPDSDDAFALQIAAAAVARGPRAALDRLDAVAAGAHVRVLGTAARKLIALREYDVLLPLYTQLADLDASWKKHLVTAAQLTKIDLAKLGPADPMRVALLAYLARSGQPPKDPPWDADTARALERVSYDLDGLALLDWRVYGHDGQIDEAAAVADPRIEGDAHDGWRVAIDDVDGPGAFYVVLDHGRARLIGGTSLAGHLGAYALGLLAHKDTAGAARWMDHLIQDLNAGHPKGGVAEAVDRYLAIEGVGDAPPELVERTAALFASSADAARAAPILRRCPGAATDDDRALCRAALYTALEHLGKWNEILDVAGKVTSPLPGDSRAMIPAFIHLERTADAAPVLDDLIAASPHDHHLIAERARVAELLGGPDDAKPFLDQLVAPPDASITDLNSAAWTHLARDATPDEALAIATRASVLPGAAARGGLQNTLAAARAESDQPWEAWEAEAQAIDARPGREPTADDWYVLGRIAESYGLRDDAIAAYRHPKLDAISIYGEGGFDLAQRALARLEVKPQPRPRPHKP